MRHPAENYIRFLIVRGRAQPAAAGTVLPATQDITNDEILRNLDSCGLLPPEPGYLDSLKANIPAPPAGFDPANRLHRPSVQYLREQKVYEMFFRTPAVDEAWEILSSTSLRQMVEYILLNRACSKSLLQKVNKKHSSHLTEEGVERYGHYFWNVDLLTFDQWGKYLYQKSSMAPDYLTLLRAPREFLLFKLRLEQQIESKMMIKRAQDIAYHTLEQVSLQPGASSEKVKSIALLTKSLVECDESLSASDAALGNVLKQFERFRAENNQAPPNDILTIAPDGSYTGGAKDPAIKGN